MTTVMITRIITMADMIRIVAETRTTLTIMGTATGTTTRVAMITGTRMAPGATIMRQRILAPLSPSVWR
jgi:hypothetical protein